MSEICLCVAAETVGEMSDLIHAQACEVKMVELRIDHLVERVEEELLAFVKSLKLRGIEILWTVRWSEEKGRFSGSEKERLFWLNKGDAFGVDWIDVEWKSGLHEQLKLSNAKVVLSHHNFEALPEDAAQLVKTMSKTGADIVKLAFEVASTKACAEVMDLYQHAPEGRLLAIAMGEFGEPSRLFGAKLGMPWTYASADGDGGTAPGQFSISELADLYRYRNIGSETPAFVVVGDPVAHSLSPQIHNRHYGQQGIDAVYGRVRVDEMSAFEHLAKVIGLRGASVTVPHKEALMKHLPDGHQLLRIGAANTLIDHDGTWEVANTDIEAALAAIELQLDESIESPKVLMLGAGGVARSLAFGMLQKGWRVTVSNRSQGRVEKLLEEISGLEWLHWEDRNAHGFDVVVNGTSLGMEPHEDKSPLDFDGGHRGLVVFDTVYTPEHTVFLTEARAAGARTVTGREMFYRQAALQHAHWFGGAPPWESMEAILSALS